MSTTVALRELWLNEDALNPERTRALIVYVPTMNEWHWSCPGHGGKGSPTWAEAVASLADHLAGWAHGGAS